MLLSFRQWYRFHRSLSNRWLCEPHAQHRHCQSLRYHEGSYTRWRRIPCYRSPSDTLQCSSHTWRCRALGTTRPKCGRRSRSDTALSRTDGPTWSLRPSPRTAQPSTPCVTRSRGPTSSSVPRSGTVQCRIACYPRTRGRYCPWARQSGVAGCHTACLRRTHHPTGGTRPSMRSTSQCRVPCTQNEQLQSLASRCIRWVHIAC